MKEKFLPSPTLIRATHCWAKEHCGKKPFCSEGDVRGAVRPLGREDPPEEGTATHSSILAGDSHGKRNLVASGPQSHNDLDVTEETEHKSKGHFNRRSTRFSSCFYVLTF